MMIGEKFPGTWRRISPNVLVIKFDNSETSVPTVVSSIQSLIT